MRVAWAWLLAALLVPSAAAQVLVAVVPDLPGPGKGDEAAAVWSPHPVNLAGWSLTDGEGTWTFPDPFPLAAGERAWIVGNASAWAMVGGDAPRATWSRIQLANDGDDLRLVAPDGTVADEFSWGKGGTVRLTSPGLVYQRHEGPDGRPFVTGADGDWVTPREHVVGESRLPMPTFAVSRVTAHASPDSSHAVLVDLMASATRRLHLHVYELRSPTLADALVAARQAHPGLDLQVLVESSPVGRDQSELHAAADALRRVEAAGGEAWLGGGAPGRDRYNYHHLKVLVADDAVAVQSENWVPTGVPEDPSFGNRGWGLVVHDRLVADWFAAWMAEDRAAWDTAPFDLALFDPLFREPYRFAARTGDHGPVIPPVTLEGTFTVRPVVSPDHTQDPARDPIAAVVRAATQRVWVQQLDLSLQGSNRLGWQSEDPLVAALAERARAAVDVRVQAAAPFSVTDTGNEEAMEALRAAGAQAHTFGRPGIAALHNKAILADETVVLGSVNGNHHSRSANREVALIVEGPAVAEAFARMFRSDWDPPHRPRDTAVIAEDLRGLSAPVPTLFVAALVALAARR